ncbi:hypothetical protein N9Q36_01435 [Flavobacteriales bacterium]|nr:hypothetical protein [Flavobacteriales bacterium]
MSNYLFENSKKNDLLRLEGPIGTFFLRESNAKNLLFLATGTGVAPIKSMLDNLENSYEALKDKNLWDIIGARFKKDLFW